MRIEDSKFSGAVGSKSAKAYSDNFFKISFLTFKP